MDRVKNDWLRDVVALAEERGFMVVTVEMEAPFFVELMDDTGGRVRLGGAHGLNIKTYLNQLTAVKRAPAPLFSDVSGPSTDA